MINKIKNNAFARNSLILFAGTMAGNFLAYLFHFIIGRMVAVDVYGEIQSLSSLLGIIAIPAATIGMAATKHGAFFKSSGNKIGAVHFFKYLNYKIIKFGLPFLLICALFVPLIKNFLKIEHTAAIFLILLAMFLSFLTSVSGGILNGWQRFKDTSLAGVVSVFTKLFFGVLLVKLGYSLNGVIGSLLLSGIILYLANILSLKNLFGSFSAKNGEFQKENKKIFKKSLWPIFAGNIAIALLMNADMVLAKHNLSPDMAGNYGALSIAAKIIFFATGVIASVVFSMSAENNFKRGNSAQILKHAFWLVFLACIVSVSIYFLFPKLVLGILFGAKFQDVSGYLGWFAVAISLFSISHLFIQYFLSVSEHKYAYFLLGLSFLEIFAILTLGNSIASILFWLILTQIGAILASIPFLFKQRKKNYEQIDLYNSPSL